eukprot:8473-Lingulodinium_polyedra.AAC.1
MTGDHEEEAQPECLFNPYGKPGKVVDVRGSLCRIDDWVVANRPEEHARGVAHANAARQPAKRA